MDTPRFLRYIVSMYPIMVDPTGQIATEYPESDLSREQLLRLVSAQALLIDDLQLAQDTLVDVILRERTRTRQLAEMWEQAMARIDALNRKVFGRTSERQQWSPAEETAPTADSPSTPPSPESPPTAEPTREDDQPESRPTEPGGKRPRGQQAGQPGHGRTRFDPTQSGLPVRHEYLEAPDAALPCPRCGALPERAGTEDSQLVDFRVQLELVEVHRFRYRRTCGCFPPGEEAPGPTTTEPAASEPSPPESPALVLAEPAVESAPAAEADPPEPMPVSAQVPTALAVEPMMMVVPGAARAFTAPPPVTVVPRSRFTLEFVVQLLTWKYVWGVPLHRLGQVWDTQNARIAPGTLVGVLRAVGPVLQPLYEALRLVNQREPWWHADETSWKVFVESENKTHYRWWLWVFSGPHSTVFLLSPTRSGQVPRDHLLSFPDGDAPPDRRKKRLMSDYYSGYRTLPDGIEHAWCWAHIRRRFFDLGKADATWFAWSLGWLQRIHQLYRLHRRRAQAPEHSTAWWEADRALRAWVEAAERQWQAELKEYGPTSRPGKVLATVQREWSGLILFLDRPDIPLDNNAAERLLRRPVVGRKNYYGSRAEWSGQLAAMIWTFWATAQQMGRNPLQYLQEYLTAVANNHHKPLPPTELARFVPTLGP